ncbi:MAG: divalent-cation tolerance protein CutA [Rheinheimera sp.]|nr:divalent-cation tolerance protein CutA [Rheinheimera sp.]
MPKLQIILCNCPDEGSADQIASELLNARLAACINLLPGVRSIYRWQGQIETAVEVTLLIKAPAAQFDAISQTICRLHPYTVPEIIAVPVSQGFLPYLHWVNEECVPNE